MLFAVADVAMKHLMMSNDELWLIAQFTEDMERRFQVRNFTSNSSTNVLEQHATVCSALHKTGSTDSCFLEFFYV
jgi:hypothetical protein